MKHRYICALLAASICAAWVSPGAAEPPGVSTAAASATGQAPVLLSADQRAAIAQELATRFRSQIKSGDFAAWSSKLTKAVAAADPANVLRATSAPKLEAMLSALTAGSTAGGGATPQALGSETADLVYTPLPNGRCRIANSSVINIPLPANVKRSIDVEDISTYSAQGGSGTFANGDGSTNCGIPSFATSFLVSVTVNRSGTTSTGLIYLFPDNEPAPKGNYLILNSSVQSTTGELNVRSCQTCAFEIAIRPNIPVNYVIDVIGYFMKPQATALDCYQTANTALNVTPGGTENVAAAACAAGYTPTSTNCESSSWLMPLVYFSGGKCSARNNGTADADLRASRTCCRVPGR